MTDGYFLPKHEQDQLVELLDQIPPLIEDLTIALTRQDRITTGGPRVRSGSDEQPLPIGIAAMDASDLLHDTLTGWVRLVCDVRAYGYPGDSTLTLTRWLKTHIIALALTPGAEESLDEIQHAIRKARQAVDKPREKDRDVNPIDVLEATFVRLNAAGIAKLAGELGPHYRGLNERRVATLLKAKAITVIDTVDGLDLYRVGDVLTAHLAYPTRKRKAA
ncbi:hypothetical protein [Rhodococcus sp. SJ-2]